MPLLILIPLGLMFGLFREILDLIGKPKYRALFIWIAVVMLVGTIFYHQVESWSWVDSFYFSVITLATVGYGDFAPTTDASKLFTVVYIFFGISIFISFASLLAKDRQELYVSREKKSKAAKQGSVTSSES